MEKNTFTHVNQKGEAHMVDVSNKQITKRYAKAFTKVYMNINTLNSIKNDKLKKGDVLATARIGGIMASKKTWELIPLCHNIPIEEINIDLSLNFETLSVDIICTTSCNYKTGIEMEAIVGANMAGIIVYDMCKAIDKEMVISDVKLLEKSGGKKDYKISD